jgi:hypothetical protein
MSLVKKTGLLVGVIGAAALLATAAWADEDNEGWHGRKHRGYYYPPPVVVYRQPVYVMPPPVVYEPVYPAYPVYREPQQPGMNLNINVPLR